MNPIVDAYPFAESVSQHLFYSLSDDNSELEPPDPIPNSAVKGLSADGSLGSPHARVGHRQALTQKHPATGGVFWC